MLGCAETRARETGESADTLIQALASAIPMGRFGRREELADLVAFRASEQNGYITGTTILVGGGVVRSVL